MERLRVLLVHPRVPYPIHDAGALSVWNMLQMLRHDPEVVCSVVAMNTQRHWVEPQDIAHIYESLPLWWAAVDNRITPWGALKNLLERESYHVSRFQSKEFASKLKEAIQQFDPDVVLIEGLPPTQYIRSLRQWTSATIIYRAHNIEHRIWQRLMHQERNFLKRRYLQIQVTRLQRYEIEMLTSFPPDSIITFTYEDAQSLREFGFNRPILVKPFPIRLEEYKPCFSGESPPSLFHIGSLQWTPNADAVVWFIEEIFPLVRRQVPHATFHLAGYIPPGFHLPTGDGVVVHGVVPDARAFMRERSILVVPLRAGSGIRVKIIEAMALGKAVVSTRIGAEGITCRSGEHLLLADSAEEFAAAVVELLRNPTRIEQLGKNARQYIEQHHNWEQVQRDFVEFLKHVAEQNPKRR